MKKIHAIGAIVVALVMCLTACSGKMKMEAQIAIANKSCPMVLDELTTITEIKSEGDYVVYVTMVDDTGFDFNTMKENTELLRFTLLASLAGGDEEVKEFLNLCKSENYGIIYRYHGITSKDEFDVKIETSDLDELDSVAKLLEDLPDVEEPDVEEPEE